MKIKSLYILITAVTFFASCTKKFDSINTDPTKTADVDPNTLLSTAEINYAGAIAGYGGSLIFHSMWAQIFANAEALSYYTNGDKYVASSNLLTYTASIWNNGYGAASTAKEIQNIINAKNLGLTNLSSVSYIVQLLNLELITDTYGDCPYSQALQAKTGSLYTPVYDRQQDIYPSMLNSLDSVISVLNTSKDEVTNDVIYDGDILKWKKLGYSLMLRMAMRLTKVDAATAQKYAEKAAAGGTFASVDDNAFVRYDNADGYKNGNSGALVVPEDYAQVKWGQYLISWLKANNDPRLGAIAEVPDSGLINQSNETLAGDNTPANQLGMPNGYDQSGSTTDISKSLGYLGGTGTGVNFNPIGKYSRPRTSLYLDLSAPVFVLTYAETELLLAEAATNGWKVGSTAAAHYHNGVSAALQTYSTFNSNGTISAATAEAYATAHSLASPSSAALQQIYTQFWVTTGTLFNFTEAWTNWRRTGYPVLTPVNYKGNFSNGQIPRREIYPIDEATNNGGNYNAAVANMGGDTWTTHVWWDK